MKMMDKAEKCLDPQLWHACAGGLVQIPPLNSKVFYFPQGHAEHSNGPVCFMASPNIIPSFILCKLTAVNYMADRYTDEVFARITLVPLKADDFDPDDDWPKMAHQNHEKAAKSSFAKTLTQSDANNGGGFSVPRYCAETIFPGLDYSSKPPVQTIVAKDVHGESWKFRHIYRGTPRRHLLTTGWSNFVNQKKLMAGDSIVFMRAENGELCIGIRRAKLGGFGGGPEFGVGQGLKGFDDADGARKVVPESVAQAAALAAIGRQFEVVYYPRASAPEFVVSAYSLSHSMKVQWSSGMRFKMPFETEDSSRISWFMGTISLVQVADPIRWPDSPWRLLQVAWDEPDLLQNVRRVSPWLVELVPEIPTIHPPLFSPLRKKPRASATTDFSPVEQVQHHSSFPSNSFPMGQCRNITPAGLQGARHAHYGLSPWDSNISKAHHSLSVLGDGSQHQLHNHRFGQPPCRSNDETDSNTSSDNVSCSLTMATPRNSFHENIQKRSCPGSSPHILLFGQVILTEHHQTTVISSLDPESSSSDGDNSPLRINSKNGLQTVMGLGVKNGHGNVFMDPENALMQTCFDQVI